MEKKKRIKIEIEKDNGKRIKKKKEFVRIVTKKRKRKSINMIVSEEIVEIERSVIVQEKSTQINVEMIFRKIVMREAEAKIITRKIKIESIKKIKSVEIAHKKKKKNIVAHEKEKKEAIIDLFIIKKPL